MRPTGFLVQRFEEQPDRPAVIAPVSRCTFGELVGLIEDWSAELRRQDVRPGAVVSLEGEFSPTSIALLFALVDHGAIVVPHDKSSRVDRKRRDALAQVELSYSLDPTDEARLARTGRAASHELYDELRRRGHSGLVQFTSGTSGEPKAAVHDSTLVLEKFKARRAPHTTLAFLLFGHLGGPHTMLHALSSGGTLVTTDDRSADTVCRLVEEHAVELLPATPTFFNLLLLSGAHRRYDMSSVRVISYGGEPMPTTTLTRLRAAFPDVKLQQTYGMIEWGAPRTKSREDGSLWVKIGGEGFETRVVDGMLEVRARSMLLGYLNAPTPLTDDGWFKTGDAVEQDGDFLRFLGRASDLINVGGEKVYPAEVEEVIESMEGVAEAVVHGEANGIVGQIVCARVTPATDGAEDLARQVKQFCRKRLERFKVPVKVEVVGGEPTGDRVKKSRRQGG